MTYMARIGLTILFNYFVLLYLFYIILLYVATLLTFFWFYSFYFIFYCLTREWGCCSTLTKARALKEGKKNIFRGKRGLKWLHSYGKRRSYIEREKHSNFQK